MFLGYKKRKEECFINSFIPWIGGKKLLRKEIVSRFPPEFDRYIEVFGGAGWVLFLKDKHASMEVWNDIDGELVNLYRCIKYHIDEIKKELDFIVNSRELFMDYKEQIKTRGLTDIQRAARYFILIKTSYGAGRSSFGCVCKNIANSIEYLDEIKARLTSVVIENKDFENLIKVYDKKDALIYLDPPYYMTEKYYNNEFAEKDHLRLKSCLNNIKGKFILSYNDDPWIRELYSDYVIDEVSRRNSLAERYDSKGSYKELIIKNY